VGRWAWISVLSLGCCLSGGCGGGSSDTTQQIRVVMASPDAPPVDILIDGSEVATSIAFTNSTAYLPVKTGNRQVAGETVRNSTTVFQQSVAVAASANQTLVVTGPAAKTQTVVLSDGNTTSTTVATGDGSVRLVNASTRMGPADVYIVNAGTGIAGAKPVATNVDVAQSIAYQLTAIGNYEIFLTAPGTTNVFLDTGPLALTQGQYQTVVAVDESGGGFNYLVLTDQ